MKNRPRKPSSVFTLSARIEANPGARLLSAAKDIFYSHGYAMAGINEVIEKSNTSKKSFYHYYPSKTDLGHAFLLLERDNLYELVDHFINKNPNNYKAFITSWSRFLKLMGRSKSYKGCPFANLSAQSTGEFTTEITNTMGQLKDKLIQFLEKSELALKRKEAEKKAKSILVLYEGCIQMWKLTGDISYFDQFKDLLIA
ncbi:TetR family transcriptional regulator [Leptospira kobayashii]|uniref:TetR family transcriptional regulator n=1 Tax=Leptospira kobayashii TaxID=1917830 RepID=A0ABN6KGG5_9LEPT|nr:TetR/AcrR family transcriptional regulator [Leptospira kobayashii]BDA78627.1 TetR family transcriptional regulator [Leptospira kobayashii]